MTVRNPCRRWCWSIVLLNTTLLVAVFAYDGNAHRKHPEKHGAPKATHSPPTPKRPPVPKQQYHYEQIKRPPPPPSPTQRHVHRHHEHVKEVHQAPQVEHVDYQQTIVHEVEDAPPPPPPPEIHVHETHNYQEVEVPAPVEHHETVHHTVIVKHKQQQQQAQQVQQVQVVAQSDVMQKMEALVAIAQLEKLKQQLTTEQEVKQEVSVKVRHQVREIVEEPAPAPIHIAAPPVRQVIRPPQDIYVDMPDQPNQQPLPNVIIKSPKPAAEAPPQNIVVENYEHTPHEHRVNIKEVNIKSRRVQEPTVRIERINIERPAPPPIERPMPPILVNMPEPPLPPRPPPPITVNVDPLPQPPPVLVNMERPPPVPPPIYVRAPATQQQVVQHTINVRAPAPAMMVQEVIEREDFIIQSSYYMEVFDILFIVHAGRHINHNGFERVKRFIRSMVHHLNIEQGTKVAMMTYNQDPIVQFSFDSYSSKMEMKNLISKCHQHFGGTQTGRALEFALNNVLTLINGHNGRHQTVVVLFTDSRSTDSISSVASRLRSQRIVTIAVGISAGHSENWPDLVELEQLTGGRERVFMLDDCQQLDGKLLEVIHRQISIDLRHSTASSSQLIKETVVHVQSPNPLMQTQVISSEPKLMFHSSRTSFVPQTRSISMGGQSDVETVALRSSDNAPANACKDSLVQCPQLLPYCTISDWIVPQTIPQVFGKNSNCYCPPTTIVRSTTDTNEVCTKAQAAQVVLSDMVRSLCKATCGACQ